MHGPLYRFRRGSPGGDAVAAQLLGKKKFPVEEHEVLLADTEVVLSLRSKLALAAVRRRNMDVTSAALSE